MQTLNVLPVPGPVADELGAILLYVAANVAGVPVMPGNPSPNHGGRLYLPGMGTPATRDEPRAILGRVLAGDGWPDFGPDARDWIESILTPPPATYAELMTAARALCAVEPGYGTPAYRGDPLAAVAMRQRAEAMPGGRAMGNAAAWMDSIHEMIQRIGDAEQGDDRQEEDDAREAVQESILSIQVRGGWYNPGDDDKGGAAESFELLLTTGGPALRIVGELDGYGQPMLPVLQWQDWGTPWTDAELSDADGEALQHFVNQFYYGEG